jgi:predicted enzyme related to lactoylglutathione lyase
MPNNVCHFDIHADDLARARRFYERVFGWQFRAWGPPDFFLIQTGPDSDPGVQGALTRRHEPVAGQGLIGFECTISVEDIDATAAAIEANGGKVVQPRTVIATVGTLVRFHDTEANVACAMQYDPSVR